MSSNKRGMSLMTVLLGMTVLLLLLFTMAEASVFHLQFATSLDSRQEAKNLAESAVNEALAEFLGNDQYGKTSVQVLVPGDGDPTRNYGVVSFLGADSRVPNSLNNLGSLNQVQGSTGHGVPGNTIHIVGRGRVGDSTSTVEAIYYRPPFPKALSASGRIHAIGTIVAGRKPLPAPLPGSTPAPPVLPIPEADKIPGCIQTNCALRGQTQALVLDQCAISGDAAAVGAVQLDASTRVDGEVRQNGAPQAIPHIDVAARINDIKDASSTEILTGMIGSKTLNWFAGSHDPLLTINGDLELKNGVLWTEHDLLITGYVKGQGLILCGGKVEIRNGTQIAADNLIALAAVGDVKLSGQGGYAQPRQSNCFQGIVYTKGNFQSQDLTVLGSVITDSSDPAKGTVDLNNVYVEQTPESVNIAQGGLMRVWQTKSIGQATGIGGLAAPARDTNPPPQISYRQPQHGGPGTPDPTATLSGIVFSITPTAPCVLNETTADYTKYNYVILNSGSPRGPTNPIYASDKFGINGNPKKPFGTRDPGNTVGNVIQSRIRMSGMKAYYSPLVSKRDDVNDVVSQVDGFVAQSIQEQIPQMLFPPVNSLTAPGERSRVLLWRSY